MCETHTEMRTMLFTPVHGRDALRGSFSCTSELEMSAAQQSSLFDTQPTKPSSSFAFPFIFCLSFYLCFLVTQHTSMKNPTERSAFFVACSLYTQQMCCCALAWCNICCWANRTVMLLSATEPPGCRLLD